MTSASPPAWVTRLHQRDSRRRERCRVCGVPANKTRLIETEVGWYCRPHERLLPPPVLRTHHDAHDEDVIVGHVAHDEDVIVGHDAHECDYAWCVAHRACTCPFAQIHPHRAAGCRYAPDDDQEDDGVRPA